MLWFHHVPYTHKLKSGDTVIQFMYDAHYYGAETAQTFPKMWETLKGKIDTERYEHMLYRLKYQAGHSIVWRDAVCMFYRGWSGIEDTKGRVNKHPYRIEAENMQLSGYSRAAVTPTEMASGGAGVTARGAASATTKLDFPDGTYDLGVNYFDLNTGKARWELAINDVKIGEWTGDIEDKINKAATDKLDGHSAARMTFHNITIKKGDTVKISGTPNGGEAAPLDYIVVLPSGIVD
jgi:alpha-glucuronidase